MYYCFVKEDLIHLPDGDPLQLQVNYARRLGQYCCCDLDEQKVTDSDGRLIDVRGKNIFLRATCETMRNAINVLEKYGVILIEPGEAIERIENWEQLSLTKRQIFTITHKDIFENTLPENVRVFLENTPRLFLKSKAKGFCAKMPSEKLLESDDAIRAFLKERCANLGDELLLTEELNVKSDSLGRKEARYFVFENQIANASRTLHSLKHAVPKTLSEKAEHIVNIIAQREDFPSNYVLDIGLFEKDGEVFADVVELNPITSSMCYVNNSIFEEDVAEITDFKKNWKLGAEYCYDAVRFPERYVQMRHTGAVYTYLNEEHYTFT